MAREIPRWSEYNIFLLENELTSHDPLNTERNDSSAPPQTKQIQIKLPPSYASFVQEPFCYFFDKF